MELIDKEEELSRQAQQFLVTPIIAPEGVSTGENEGRGLESA